MSTKEKKMCFRVAWGIVKTLLFFLSMFILPCLPKKCLTWFLVHAWGRLLGLNGTIQGRDTYQIFKNQRAQALAVFTHPTFFDMIPICHVAGETLRSVVKSKYIIGPLRCLAGRLNMILVYPTPSGVSQQIATEVKNRQERDDLICMAPTGTTLLTKQDVKPLLYHKGAFGPMAPILPFVMYYSSVTIWDKQSLFGIVLERMCGPTIYYHAMALEPLEPMENETQDQFMERTKTVIENGILHCKRIVEARLPETHRFSQ